MLHDSLFIPIHIMCIFTDMKVDSPLVGNVGLSDSTLVDVGSSG